METHLNSGAQPEPVKVHAAAELALSCGGEESDEEPITEAWLLSVGYEVGRLELPRDEADDHPRLRVLQTPLRFLVEAFDAEDIEEGCLIASVKTRGEFRRLCAALQITLKEPTDAAI